MRPPGRTFWLLDGRIGWQTDAARSSGIVASPSGLALEADPEGPLALGSADGSLGGLVLPRGLALDATGALYLLERDEPRIARLDPSGRRFRRLPEVGGRGGEARRFRDPTGIAVDGRDLFVADRGNRRVQVFDLVTLALRFVWGPFDHDGRPVAAAAANAWWPVDVAAGERRVHVLDQRYNRIWVHRLGSDVLRPLLTAGGPRLWSRLAVDREGRIYAFDAWSCRLDVFDAAGRPLGRVGDAGDVRDRFPPPPVRLDHRGRIRVPLALLRPCAADAPPPDRPAPSSAAAETGELLFDRNGRPARRCAEEPPGAKTHLRRGTWVSRPLDSSIHRCVWHRIEIELTELPPGSRVTVATATAPEDTDDAADPAAVSAGEPPRWETAWTITGPAQPQGAPATDALRSEFLVQSDEGRYLRLAVRFEGDGWATPVVGALRVHYPRQSYLQYLPAVFAAADDAPTACATGDDRGPDGTDGGSRSPGRRFLERFLAIMQTTWDDLEQRLDELPAYVDPDAVPEGPHLDFLAHWLGVSLETARDGSQKRRLLTAAPRLQGRRGTPDVLLASLRVHIENIAGISGETQRALGYPVLVEGFRERRQLMLSLPSTAELGHGAPMWSRDHVARLQLDVYAREGEARLVSTGDPDRDPFHAYAHRFRVFVPAAWIRSAEAESALRRAIDDDKPAHAAYELHLVELGLRVGVQASVGIDSIVGDRPPMRLAGADDDAISPRLPSPPRLGERVLSGGGPGGTVRSRIGVDVRVGRTSMLG